MSAPRGARGGDRGRGTRGGGAPNRGTGGRGRGNGSPAHNNNNNNNNNNNSNNSERPSQGVYTRGQAGQRGHRGGPQRGGANTGGAHNAHGNTQGRGGNTNPFISNATSAANMAPLATGDYKQRLDRIKQARPNIRAQFIRDGLMNPEGQMRLSDSVKLIGICTEMCPEYERVRRIVEEDVKAPECTPETEHLPRKQRIPDESRMVKAYARSAAGMDVELVSEIRSPATCLKTVNYLFERLDHDDFQFLHQWIWDRTRAVRKDLRTQRIESKPDISTLLTCLERSARFLLLSTHHMARSTKEDYTHQQDVEQLNQTLMSLKERYVDNRRANIPSENEAEFWAYRLILAPLYANTQLENELHGLPSDLQHNPRVKTAIEIFRVFKSVIITDSRSFVQVQSNWKKFWELIKSPRVSYLMACAAEISFNRVRHVVLDSIWRAYRRGTSRRLVTVEDWTTDKLKDVLGLDTAAEAVKLCEAYGFVFSVNNDKQSFLDITQMGYANQVLRAPSISPDFKPQLFSASIVEPKRHSRALSAVIQGMSVQQARASGLLIDVESDMQVEEETGDENSLFVPEASAPNTKVSNQQPNGITTTPGTNQTLSPFASPFQPGGTSPATTNPFLKATSQTQSNQASIGVTPAGIQPGVFDPSKNFIQFAPNGGASNTPTSTTNNTTLSQPTPHLTSANPFLNGAGAAAIPQSNPFAQFATPKPEPTAAATTPQPAPAFNFPGLSSNEAGSQESPQPGLSFTPSEPPPQADTTSQEAEKQKAEQERRQAAEKQQREAEARQRVLDARRAREAEEAEQRRRQTEEAEQRKRQQQLQEEQERKAREEQERLVREAQRRQTQEEEARIARVREKESTFQSLTADIMFHPEDGLMLQFVENTALNIAQEVFREIEMEKKEELANKMYGQYQQTLKRAGLAKLIAYAEKVKRDRRARERRKRIKEQRAQMASMHEDQGDVSTPADPVRPAEQPNGDSNFQPPAPPPSARRAKRTEQRRGGHEQNGASTAGLTNNAHQTTVVQTANTPANTSNSHTSSTQYSKAYYQAAAPIDRTETDWFKLRAMGIDPSKHRKRSFDSISDEEDHSLGDPKRPKLSPPPTIGHELPPRTTAEDHLARFRAIQQTFRNSATSPPPINGAISVNVHASPVKSSSDVIAKARDILANSKSATSPSQLVNGATFLSGASSFNGESSQLIAKARELMANSPPNLQHDWGRSVPNLGLVAAAPSYQPIFGKSTNAADSRPAYWHRASRFVPRHLYGKGPDAIREYKDQFKRSPSNSTRPASTEPSVQSMTFSTQHSYNPSLQGYAQGYPHQQYDEGGASGVQVVDMEADDENAIMTDEEDFEEQQYDDTNNAKQSYQGRQHSQDDDEDADSEMVDSEDEEEDEEDEGYAPGQYPQVYDEGLLEDYDEYTDEEDESLQYAQPVQQHRPQPATQQSEQAGTTQDDAIELSD